ncbi:hypothetical protein NQ314_017450 [Rhamnusium bicolor]|uniref:Inorganic phosphate cotransporter n=1 Tax=Rhamnusium bicolor TaxID=1586634 RepID=A0AAV8WW26_9CUCU|nr:hypothetical protein NQ314_017450 [Rhamnusium bicolor]
MDKKGENPYTKNEQLEKAEDDIRKGPFFGVRHVITILLFLLLAIGYGMRVNLSVAIVAMTDNTTSENPDIPTYDWDDKSVVLSSFFWGYICLQVVAGQMGRSYGIKWFLVGTMLINSAALTGFISASWIGWPPTFYLFGIVGCLWAMAWAILGANCPAQHIRISEEERYYIESSLGSKEEVIAPTPWKEIFTSWPAWAVFVGSFGQNWGYSTLLTEIPNYMNKVMKFDMHSSPFISGTFVPSAALITLGFLPEDETTLSVTMLIIAVGVNAAVWCGFQINIVDLSPKFSGILMGIANGSSALFSIIAPLVVQVVVTDEVSIFENPLR